MSLPAVAVKAAAAGEAGGGTRARTPHSRAAVGVARQHVKDAKAGTSVDALRADLTRRGFAPETIDAATAATPAPAQVSPGRAETTAPAPARAPTVAHIRRHRLGHPARSHRLPRAARLHQWRRGEGPPMVRREVAQQGRWATGEYAHRRIKLGDVVSA